MNVKIPMFYIILALSMVALQLTSILYFYAESKKNTFPDQSDTAHHTQPPPDEIDFDEEIMAIASDTNHADSIGVREDDK